MLAYEDSYSKGAGGADFSLANLDSSGGPYPDSIGGGGGGGGGYDYTPQQNYDHHDHHDHHPEPPKGHWETKIKWKEEWVMILMNLSCLITHFCWLFKHFSMSLSI